LSKECPWRGLGKKEIAEKCAEIEIMKESSNLGNRDCPDSTDDPTTDDLSSNFDKIVQSTSKFGWQWGANQLCDMRTHVTHPVHSLRHGLRQGIKVPYNLPRYARWHARKMPLSSLKAK
jgi:hypothetical protein